MPTEVPLGKIGPKDIITLIEKKLVTLCYDWPYFRHYIGSGTGSEIPMSVSGLKLTQVNQKRLNYVKTRADVSDGTEKLSFLSNFWSFFSRKLEAKSV